MACKFVISNGEIFFATVSYHSEILKDNTKTIGGGWWHWDEEKKIIYLYGTSSDFGSVTKEQIAEAWKNSLISPFWEGCTFIYSDRLKLDDVLSQTDRQEKLILEQ